MIRRQTGLSLLELTAVIAILGVIALVVTPDFSSTAPARLELAADQVAHALRFARSESIRSGEHHGVTIDQVTQGIMVVKWNLTTDPVSVAAILYHPLSRQPYDLKADELSLVHGVAISNASDAFLYADVGLRRSLIFDPQGVPLWILGSDGSRHLLQSGTVTLSAGQSRINVAVAPLTGRVTIQ